MPKKRKIFKVGKKVFKNKFEYDTFLKLRDLFGNKVEYETEKLPYTIQHDYIPDFIIRTKSGKVIYLETKGNGRSFDSSVRQKLIAVKNQHKDIDLRLLFYADGKVGRTRKNGTYSRQSDWATKHGFVFAIKEIPEDWFKE